MIDEYKRKTVCEYEDGNTGVVHAEFADYGSPCAFFTAFALTPCRWGGQTVDEWINMADQKLYVGKSEGKNRLVM